jgi:hypothetical protein
MFIQSVSSKVIRFKSFRFRSQSSGIATVKILSVLNKHLTCTLTIRNASKYYTRNTKKGDRLGELEVDGWIILKWLYFNARSRVSSGSIVSDYGLDDRAIGVRFPAGAKDFSSNLCDQNGSGAHPASCTMGTGGPFSGGKSAAEA